MESKVSVVTKKKRLIFILIAVISIVMIYAALLLAYDKYGFTFSLPEGKTYAVAFAQYEKKDQMVECDYYEKVAHMTKEQSESFYNALKKATYTVTDTPLTHGELAYITLSDMAYSDHVNFVFFLFYEQNTDTLFLKWKDNKYEVTNFDQARYIIQDIAPPLKTCGIINEEEKTFFSMPYFSHTSDEHSYNYEHNKNTYPVLLDSDEDIIEHAKNEVPDEQQEFDDISLYKEKYGNRYLVIFTYRLPEHNIRQRICVVMSCDGVTEFVEYRLYHAVSCL